MPLRHQRRALELWLEPHVGDDFSRSAMSARGRSIAACRPDVRLAVIRTPHDQISPTKLSNSVRKQCLFTTLTRAPAHFPEFNFEPRGFLEDHDQLGLAGGRGIGIGKAL